MESPDSDLHHMRRCEESLIHKTHCSTDENNLGRSDAAAGGSSGACKSAGVSNASDWEWGSSRRNHRISLTGGRVLCGGGREIGQRSCLKRRFVAAGSRNPFPLWGGAHDDGTTKELTNI